MSNLYFEHAENDDDVKKLFNETNEPKYSYQCYAAYGLRFKKNDDNPPPFYFGMYSSEKVKELINDFNLNFKHIKIKLVLFKKYDNASVFVLGENNVECHTYAVFKIIFSKKYSKIAQYWLRITIAQFIRAFDPEYRHYRYAKLIEDNYFENTIRAFEECGSAYGNWRGNVECTVDLARKFDDIEFMNKVMERKGFDTLPYVSNLLTTMKSML